MNEIHKIKAQLESLLTQKDFLLNCKEHRKVIMHLLSLIKSYPKFSPGNRDYEVALEDCMRIVAALVHATQFEKYCHLWVDYAYVLKQYSVITGGREFSGSKIKTLARIGKNQGQIYYKQATKQQISKYELESQKNPKQLNQFLLNVTKGEVELQNPQCIACTPIFTSGLEIKNANCKYSQIAWIQGIENFSQDMKRLKEIFLAICNKGAGVIIIGAEIKNGALRAQGMEFRSMTEVLLLEKEIINQLNELIQLIKLKITRFESPQFKVQYVRVYKNVMHKQEVLQNELKFCFRISIEFSYYPKIAWFDPKHEIKECYNEPPTYTFNEKNQIKSAPILDYYQLIHGNYKKTKPVSSHQKSKCMLPCNNQSEIKLSEIQKSQGSHHNYQKQREASLLLVQRRKLRRIESDLKQAFEKQNEEVQIINLFPDRKSTCPITVLMLTHRISFPKLEYKIKQLTTDVRYKISYKNLMPGYKILRVPELSEEERSNFESKLAKQPKEIPQFTLKEVSKKGKLKQKMKFVHLRECIQAYYVLKELKKQPHFISEHQFQKNDQN